MKKHYSLFAGIGLLLSTSVMAQMRDYNFSYYTDTYTPLTGGTSLNGTTVWDGLASYDMPIGFNFTIDTVTTSHCHLGNEIMAAVASTGPVLGFNMISTYLTDRGQISCTTESPIRYQVSGTPGNRIFKVEVLNAGFREELYEYSTLNDHIDIQEWWYEGSNIVELRYGTSNISHSNDTYFAYGGTPLIYFSYYRTADTATYYVLSGDPASPTIDSIVFSSGPNATYLGKLLNSYPAEGQVYRFTPKNLGVADVALQSANVYPTAAQSEVMVDYNSNAKASYTVVSINGSVTNINGQLSHGTTHIDVSALPAGIYLVELQSSNGRATKKFVKM